MHRGEREGAHTHKALGREKRKAGWKCEWPILLWAQLVLRTHLQLRLGSAMLHQFSNQVMYLVIALLMEVRASYQGNPVGPQPHLASAWRDFRPCLESESLSGLGMGSLFAFHFTDASGTDLPVFLHSSTT